VPVKTTRLVSGDTGIPAGDLRFQTQTGMSVSRLPAPQTLARGKCFSKVTPAFLPVI